MKNSFFTVMIITFLLLLFSSCGNQLSQPDSSKTDSDTSSASDETSDTDDVTHDESENPDETADLSDEAVDTELDETTDGEQWICQISSDCDFGWKCLNDGTTADGCVHVNECEFDEDCSVNEYCGIVENWNECFSAGKVCILHTDCAFGMMCRTDFDPAFCEFVGECEVHEDCLLGFSCIVVENWKECRETIENECAIHTDCDFGNSCNTMISPTRCEYVSQCVTDYDCSDIQRCEREENWKICQLDISPDTCDKDEDCEIGEVCDIPVIGMGVCRSLNECEITSECATGYECEFNGTFNECVKSVPCVVDEDCGFGYRCLETLPENQCEYANECATADDCPALNSCDVEGNWTVCNFTSGTFCTSDANCAPDEYCDITIVAGSCVSRNQCYADEDCGDGMKCENNGTYNECVPLSTEGCLLDIQCQDGWACIDNECMPKYSGVCTEIEGNWTVWMSDVIIFPQGTTWEFIPNDGCNGNIVESTSTVPAGTFNIIVSPEYDIKMGLVQDCTASININAIMTITCDGNTAQLGRL